jgi:hypothetical protein
MFSWLRGERKLRTAKTTDLEQKKSLKLKEGWEKIFERAIMAVLYLAENNAALRASSSISYTAHNSYFRGLIELTAKYDPFSKITFVVLRRINK